MGIVEPSKHYFRETCILRTVLARMKKDYPVYFVHSEQS